MFRILNLLARKLVEVLAQLLADVIRSEILFNIVLVEHVVGPAFVREQLGDLLFRDSLNGAGLRLAVSRLKTNT